MTREELLNGYKEDVRDFAKECLHFEGELDATFFDNWAEHFTNLAERLHLPLPDDLEEAAEKSGLEYAPIISGEALDLSGQIYETDDINWPSRCGFIKGFIAGAEYQRKQDQSLIELAEDHAMLAGMNKMKEQMMEEAVAVEVVGDKRDLRLIDSAERCLFNAKRGDWLKVIVISEEK